MMLDAPNGMAGITCASVAYGCCVGPPGAAAGGADAGWLGARPPHATRKTVSTISDRSSLFMICRLGLDVSCNARVQATLRNRTRNGALQYSTASRKVKISAAEYAESRPRLS